MPAPAKADTAKPANIKRKLDAPRPANASKTNTETSAMPAAANGTAIDKVEASPKYITITAPKAAPLEAPSKPGSANGLRNSP
jgi:hypothetical protein